MGIKNVSYTKTTVEKPWSKPDKPVQTIGSLLSTTGPIETGDRQEAPIIGQ